MKYGDMINGFGRVGFVKSIEVDEDGVRFAYVESELINRFARVYLVPPVWEENMFPEIGDGILMGGLVHSEKRDANGNWCAVAGKAIFLGKSSGGYASEILLEEDDTPYTIVTRFGGGKVKMSLSPKVWFEKDLPEKNSPVVIGAINFVDGKYVAGGGCFVRC
jgi:hypothetical protein